MHKLGGAGEVAEFFPRARECQVDVLVPRIKAQSLLIFRAGDFALALLPGGPAFLQHDLRRARTQLPDALPFGNGLLAPARTGDDIVTKIYADTVKVAQSREFIELLQKQALEVDLIGPAEFRAFLAAELDKWSKLVKFSGAKLD